MQSAYTIFFLIAVVFLATINAEMVYQEANNEMWTRYLVK